MGDRPFLMPVLVQLITHLTGLRLNYNKGIMNYLNLRQWGGSAALLPLPTASSPNSGPIALSCNTLMSLAAPRDPIPPGMAARAGNPLWCADLGSLAIKIDLDSHN